MDPVNACALVVVVALGLTVALYHLARWSDPEQDAEYARIDTEIDRAYAFARQLEQLRGSPAGFPTTPKGWAREQRRVARAAPRAEGAGVAVAEQPAPPGRVREARRREAEAAPGRPGHPPVPAGGVSFITDFEASDEPRDWIEWLAEEQQWDQWDEEQTEETTWQSPSHT